MENFQQKSFDAFDRGEFFEALFYETLCMYNSVDFKAATKEMPLDLTRIMVECKHVIDTKTPAFEAALLAMLWSVAVESEKPGYCEFHGGLLVWAKCTIPYQPSGYLCFKVQKHHEQFIKRRAIKWDNVPDLNTDFNENYRKLITSFYVVHELA